MTVGVKQNERGDGKNAIMVFFLTEKKSQLTQSKSHNRSVFLTCLSSLRATKLVYIAFKRCILTTVLLQ